MEDTEQAGRFVSADKKQPDHAGWYPTLLRFDSGGDSFPTSSFWDGKHWNKRGTVMFIPQLYAEEEVASDAACAAVDADNSVTRR